jgi:hypothetical protein
MTICTAPDITIKKKDNMDIQTIVAQLRQEASRIEQAIVTLLGLGPQSWPKPF